MACYYCWRPFGQCIPTREEVVREIYEVGHVHLVPAGGKFFEYGSSVGQPDRCWRLPLEERPEPGGKFFQEFGFDPVCVEELDQNLLAATKDAEEGAFWARIAVPEGKLLVEQCSTPWLQHSTRFYRVSRAGELVTPKQLAEGRVIAHGESAKVIKTQHSTQGSEWDVRVIIRNLNGAPVIEDGEKEARKQFARDQIAYLVGLGFSEGHAYRIMKAAGPGQVRHAIEWTYEAMEHVGGNVDALDMVLSGLGGTNGFGMDRTASALEALGFSVPRASTAQQFFGILSGAKEAIVVGLPARKSAA